MDILATEEAIINLQERTLTLGKCGNVKAPVQITAKDNVRVWWIVQAKKVQIIQPAATETVKVGFKDRETLPDRDFVFEPKLPGVFTHFVNSTMDMIQVKDTGAAPMRINAKARLGSLIDYDEMECYHAGPEKEGSRTIIAKKYAPGFHTCVLHPALK